MWLFRILLALVPLLMPSKHTSALALVYAPMPQNKLSDFLFFFIHTNAAVLYVKPHASITFSASLIFGKFAHIKQIALSEQILCIGSSQILSVLIVS